MPCSSNDLTVNVPSGPIGSAIPLFGIPFAPKLPNFNTPLPDGFPEDLLDVLDALQFILPSGTIKPALNLNFGKDIFDGIIKLLDQFMPFLMLYKFFLPVLELIICIIEVLCAIPNPFKLPGAIRRLFRVCLPNFLALFPIFALVVMLLSLLFLILSLIEYIVNEMLKLVNLLLRNIATITKALSKADSPSILAAVRKIGLILCAFQNLFVIFSIFKIIVDAIKDILKLVFAIPPCDDGDNGNAEKCCTPDVCPSFIKNNDGMVRDTGTLQYLSKVVQAPASLPSQFAGFPSSFFNSDVREESWQFYDAYAPTTDAFWNITNAYDLPDGINQVFFPTDSTYQSNTPTNQVPYLVDLRLFYNPNSFGNPDPLGARFIRINNCIVLRAPTQGLTQYDNSNEVIQNGVLELVGGIATEDDGEKIFINGKNATLASLIHINDEVFFSNPILNPSDGYNFVNIAYTFHINYEVLIQKALITLGCLPSVALDRTFVNSTFGGNAGANFTFLNTLLNSNGFPDIGAAQQCLLTALSNLRNNISTQGVANFQAMTTICLNKLGDDTRNTINSLIGIGFDQYKSTFTIDPAVQFTSESIDVKVLLKETNGQSITDGLPTSIASDIASRLDSIITFGKITPFIYDGYQAFNAQISSTQSGTGTIQVSFDNKLISVASVPTDLTQSPTITPLTLDYTFIYSPSVGDEYPRRDAGDVIRELGSKV